MLNTKNLLKNVPKDVLKILEVLEKNGYEANLVGGSVRDLVLERTPKDWDINTNAVPEEIIPLFEKTVYENDFGTVSVINKAVIYETTHKDKDSVIYETNKESNQESVHRNMHDDDILYKTIKNKDNNDVIYETSRIVEITPYRKEGKYSDFRHPDEVSFSRNLEDDLKRRDFTINAMALNSKGHLTDIYDGIKDIEKKVLRTVENPDDRFQEDALRMLRAIRFAVQLNFSISYETTNSILKNAKLIKKISQERIRDEFIKIILSPSPATGITMLQKFGLLQNIIPELEEGIGCEQSGEHIYDVWNHLLNALEHSANKNWPLEVRLSALFHDIGKPRSRRNINNINGSHDINDIYSSNESYNQITNQYYQQTRKQNNFPKKQKKYTFYGHEVIGAKMTKKIMERLKFSRKEIELVEKLIYSHMFFSDTEKITLSAVRRIITKVGKENIWLLMNVRECDRIGMKKKEAPYRLRKYFAMIEEVLRDPISVGQLKIDGTYMIEKLNFKPGPRMGWILNLLLEEVLDDPKKNTEEFLEKKAKELDLLSDLELKKISEKAKEKKEFIEKKEIEILHKKHNVN